MIKGQLQQNCGLCYKVVRGLWNPRARRNGAKPLSGLGPRAGMLPEHFDFISGPFY